jgi:hypothetical protein
MGYHMPKDYSRAQVKGNITTSAKPIKHIIHVTREAKDEFVALRETIKKKGLKAYEPYGLTGFTGSEIILMLIQALPGEKD